MLFWGCFPALFRSDWKNFAINAGVILVMSLIALPFIPLIVFSFIYNEKMCLKDHLDSGWKITGYNGTKSLDIVAGKLGYNLKKYMYTENTQQ